MNDPDALREEIRQTRADLGETVQALAAKADVKARVKDAATHKRDELTYQAQQKKDDLLHRARRTKDDLLHRTQERTGRLRSRAAGGGSRAMGQARYSGGLARDSAMELGAAVRRSPRPFAVAAGVGAALAVFLMVRRRRG
ncbi:MAG TPA: DUF3618 domain-containing protein [Micromonosporaceae bacterium]